MLRQQQSYCWSRFLTPAFCVVESVEDIDDSGPVEITLDHFADCSLSDDDCTD